ncbi:MAG: pirin family protein [Bdellovibrionia bacterium]
MRYLVRKSEERGYFENDWLKSFHSFSFSEYYDPNYMGYKELRVINHDFIEKGQGFPMHGHRDMEIITYVLNGTVEHQDSLGNKAQTKAGDVQVMTAGRGIRHSEYNPDVSQDLELLQIWLLPSEKSLNPGYRQRFYSRDEKLNQLLLIASPEGEHGSMTIASQAKLYAAVVTSAKKIEHSTNTSAGYWVQVARGEVQVNDISLKTGDGLALEELEMLELKSNSEAEVLVFEML